MSALEGRFGSGCRQAAGRTDRGNDRETSSPFTPHKHMTNFEFLAFLFVGFLAAIVFGVFVGLASLTGGSKGSSGSISMRPSRRSHRSKN